MAATDKIEPRLLRELVRMESAEQQDTRVPVIIQHVHELGLLEPTEASVLDKADKARAKAERHDLLERLARMEVGQDLRRLELANSIESHLTPAQIREIASHPDVKRIIWNREERVTA